MKQLKNILLVIFSVVIGYFVYQSYHRKSFSSKDTMVTMLKLTNKYAPFRLPITLEYNFYGRHIKYSNLYWEPQLSDMEIYQYMVLGNVKKRLETLLVPMDSLSAFAIGKYKYNDYTVLVTELLTRESCSQSDTETFDPLYFARIMTTLDSNLQVRDNLIFEESCFVDSLMQVTYYENEKKRGLTTHNSRCYMDGKIEVEYELIQSEKVMFKDDSKNYTIYPTYDTAYEKEYYVGYINYKSEIEKLYYTIMPDGSFRLDRTIRRDSSYRHPLVDIY